MAKRFTILVVDDNPVDIKILVSALGRDYEIITSMNGADALLQINCSMPDLILLDVMLPDINGFDISRVVKSDTKFATIPILFLTALDTFEYEIHGFESGGIDYISKPVNLNLLKVRVKNHLELKRRSDLLDDQSTLLAQQKDELAHTLAIQDEHLKQLMKTEEKLLMSERRYRSVVEDQTEIICRFFQDGTIIFANEVYCRFFGKQQEELVGHKWHPVVFADDLHLIEHELAKLTSDNPTITIENRVYSATGELHWMQFVNRGFFNDNGDLLEMQSVGRDISERKQIERSLQLSENRLKIANEELETRVTERTAELAQAVEAEIESRERLNFALESSHTGAWERNLADNTSHQSAGHARIFGYPDTLPDWSYEKFLEHVLSEERNTVDSIISGAIKNRTSWNVECRIRRNDGEIRWVYIAGRATDTPPRAAGIVQDITSRKQAEIEIAESKQVLEAALLNMTDAVFISDSQGRCIHFNEAFATFNKFSSKDVCATTLAEYSQYLDVFTLDGEVVPLEQWAVPRALRGECCFNDEHILRRKDTGETWIGNFSFAPIYSTDGSISGSVVIGKDVTKQRQIESEIMELNRDLEQRVKERTAELAEANLHLNLAVKEWHNTFNASSDPIFLLDTDHHITLANSATMVMFDLPIEQVVGNCCHEVIHGTCAPVDGCPQCKLLEDHQSHAEEIFVEKINKYLLVTVSPIFDAVDTLVGSIHYAKDITAIKNAEQALQNINNDLESRVTKRTAELALANQQIKRAVSEQIWAEERERERIARELHDQVGQSLLLAKMKLDALVAESPSESVAPSASEAATLVASSIQDIRSLTFRMRPPLLETSGLSAALEWLCASLLDDYNFRVKFNNAYLQHQFPHEIRYSLYQVVRELLLNTVKHAKTGNAELSIREEPRQLIITVVDHGIGFINSEAVMKHVNAGGYGLFNVMQRVEKIGGTVTIDSEVGRGTAITVQVPLKDM
jgi:PAS domain S-box-containing protein